MGSYYKSEVFLIFSHIFHIILIQASKYTLITRKLCSNGGRTILLIASAKSWSARRASHRPAFMGSCLTISHTCLHCSSSR